MSDEDKHIYITISLYNLKKIFQVPVKVEEMLIYLEQLKPGKWDYKKIRKSMGNFFETYKDLLE